MLYGNYMRINGLTPGLQNAPDLCTFNDNRMHTEETMEDRLWDYIDGLAGAAEKTAVETLITANAEWQRKYRELLNVHQLMAGSDLDAPSMRFTVNVMEEIARHHVAPATKTYINKNIIRSIGGFFLTLIAGLLVYFLRQLSWTSGAGSTSSTPTMHLPNIDLGLDRVDYNKFSSNLPITLFMLVTVILGFVLLDMYLQRTKNVREMR
jgi:hypothetical protein